MGYINGISNPVFEITDVYGNRVWSTELPLTNSKGLIESYDEKYIEHEFLNYRREKKILGYNVNFTLNFDEYTSAETTLKIFKLLDWEFQISYEPTYKDYKIWLMPRRDVPSRKFHVIGMNKSMEFGVLRGGTKTIGHKGLVLNYTTKWLSNWMYTNPITVPMLILDYQNHLII